MIIDADYKKRLDSAHELITAASADAAVNRQYTDVQLPMMLVALDDIFREMKIIRTELAAIRHNTKG